MWKSIRFDAKPKILLRFLPNDNAIDSNPIIVNTCFPLSLSLSLCVIGRMMIMLSWPTVKNHADIRNEIFWTTMKSWWFGSTVLYNKRALSFPKSGNRIYDGNITTIRSMTALCSIRYSMTWHDMTWRSIMLLCSRGYLVKCYIHLGRSDLHTVHAIFTNLDYINLAWRQHSSMNTVIR